MSVSIKECALPAVRQTVQHNCHIADALYAADYTLCIYLLKMREFYRWESGLPYNRALENSSVGEWLREREQLWDSLENNQFESVVINDHQFDPFDTKEINAAINLTIWFIAAVLDSRASPISSSVSYITVMMWMTIRSISPVTSMPVILRPHLLWHWDKQFSFDANP